MFPFLLKIVSEKVIASFWYCFVLYLTQLTSVFSPLDGRVPQLYLRDFDFVLPQDGEECLWDHV